MQRVEFIAMLMSLSLLGCESWPPKTMRVRANELMSKKGPDFVCAGIGVIDDGSNIDGDIYYFSMPSKKLIGACGGVCMDLSTKAREKMCTDLCPPPEWTSNNCVKKWQEDVLSKEKNK